MSEARAGTGPSFGVTLFQGEPVTTVADLARRVEELGYAQAWVGDSQWQWRDTYVTLAALGGATSRMELGVAVTNPLTRHPAVTANAFTTLQELTGGRAILGIGLGDSALRVISDRPAKLETLREAVVMMRALMRGEEVLIEKRPVRLGFADPAHTAPIFVGGTGPKLLELGGEVGDGVILMVGAQPQLLRHGLDRIAAGAARAGRDPASVRTVAWIPMSIDADGERARRNVRAHAARWAIRNQPFDFEPRLQEVVDRIREVYDFSRHLQPDSPQAAVVTDEFVDMSCIAGTPEECRRRARELAESGIDHVALIPHGPGRQEQVELFAREVLTEVSGARG